jgi:hypothetical protein
MRRLLIVSFLLWLTACGENAPGCTSVTMPTDCAASAKGPWRVDVGTDPLNVKESRKGSVTPGLPVECASSVESVSWSVENPVVASVFQLGTRNDPRDTAGDISRAWVTGQTPGVTMVRARVMSSDGHQYEAQPLAISVVEPEAPPGGSFLVAQGTAEITLNQYTGSGGAEPIPFTLPAPGRVDVTVNWTSFSNNLDFSVWKGICSALPCSGRNLLGVRLGPIKPVRGSANMPAGDCTLVIGGAGPSGGGHDTARYQVRLTPD